MILPDVNVLLYAFRRDVERHGEYRQWLEGVVNGRTAYGVATHVLAGVIRVATHSRIFKQPSPIAEAVSFCQA